MAEVTLVFNNNDRILDIEYSEVSITRRSYRSQDQNEYYINKNLVRRKDIKNLFLDTGLGNTDLSIISQGSVAKVTESKPDDLKQLLNEASGVARYQQQKEESLRKLEKVSNNLEIFSVKLNELEKQVGPLRRAAEKAKKNISIKEKLASIELSLIKEQLSKDLGKRKELEKILEETNIEKSISKEKISAIKEKQNEIKNKVLELDNKLYNLQSKQVEASKNNSSSTDGDSLKANEKQIKDLVISINDLNDILINSKEKESEIEKKLSDLKDNEFNYIQQKERYQHSLQSTIYEIERISSAKNNKIGYGTRVILENLKIFNEVYGMVSDIIEYDDKYESAINVAIGGKLTNLVVSDDSVIKEAIKWLKSNKYGTATFIPAKQIKPKFISEEFINAIINVPGYIGPLSNVIKTKQIFKNVVSSLSGNILLFDNVDNAMKASKFMGYKFMIVTLDGDVVYPGFTVRGGYSKKEDFNAKKEELKTKEKNLNIEVSKTRQQIADTKEQISQQQYNLSSANNEQVRAQERINELEILLQRQLESFKSKTGKDFDIDKVVKNNKGINNLSIEQINNELEITQADKTRISKELLQLEKKEDELREVWEKAIELHAFSQVDLNNLVSNIDLNITILNKDYKMTWEALEQMEVPKLSISYEKANSLRVDLRKELESLGFVDFDSIERYEEVSKDYEELKTNTNDLVESKEKLISTIQTMDEKMVTQFTETFDKVNRTFQKTFETLFRGGAAQIKYTDPENILESGITLDAQVPGKTIKNMSLYSGGEKSLIALSLIFAINEVRNLPLLLLDEVEAALDEANVERFANFAKKLNENTQLIIVTHRPGTMERAEILYGVTMQEKGVTKIVSVKLEEAVDLTN